MIIVEEFATKLQIELISELGYTLLDVFGLNFQILVVVKAVFHNGLQNYAFFTKHANFFVTLK